MPFDIEQFQKRLRYGGARPALFQVVLHPPTNFGVPSDGSGREFAFKCRSAQQPGATVSSISVPYFGRFIKVRGNRTFSDWTVTVIQDESFAERNMLEAWQNGINHLRKNTAKIGLVGETPENYKTEATILPLSLIHI